MDKLQAIHLPPWAPGADLLHPLFRYTTAALPATLHEALSLVEADKKTLWAFVAMTAFNPIFWNTVARNEYRNKTITRLVGSPLVGTYILALTIFSISAFRDHLFLNAVKDQPALAFLGHPVLQALALAFFLSGQTFVISSMWALGVTGTYLGDYFGILMTHRVTSFPFNVLSDPMYVGSFLSHLGTALWFRSPVGIALGFWVWVVYAVALKFEGPFTDNIYAAQNKRNTSSPSPTSSTFPTTPSRRSGRIAAASKSSAPNSDADSDNDRASTTATATPGRRVSRRKSGLKSEIGATPARVTRSRSRGAITSGEE
ncbi:methylene-fatty-acyl-phospholipid synthase [Cryptococcus wingfieldii CBS 7118]|uniref:Phosphatidyl-N-methylethanolamine N-methyltransferase n=1 Tax=Cryptococcus wingfieldii CBS 7118 TaxID=1295528 RepID=A0A1E3J4X5_9TREE|nr:methylene-fatty-acyl-phospholipid synthase [Cryptococcus wingfieldii CBS 7118]ODN95902.1 methylene-fatty-acyl-phospholipid synthase [Cryptococcus wingfieldii CBS 7118]